MLWLHIVRFFQTERLGHRAEGLVAGETGLEGDCLVVLEQGDQLPVHTVDPAGRHIAGNMEN